MVWQRQAARRAWAARAPIRSWLAARGITRPRQGRWLAGVCAGIAERMPVDAKFVRIVMVAATIMFPAVIVGYLLAWMLIPDGAGEGTRPPTTA